VSTYFWVCLGVGAFDARLGWYMLILGVLCDWLVK
jgi:hypothetical protein